jgi:glycosyltransferase involved in cell wall biosynthesis
MRVVVFGTYDESTHPRVRVLREGLAASGVELESCNVPLGLDTTARVRIAQRPWLAPVLLARIAAAWVRLWWRSRSIAPPDAVLVGYLGHFDVHLARRLFRRSTIVLDHMVSLGDTARDRRLGDATRVVRLLDRLDRRALRAADIVLLDTAEQRVQVPEDVGAPVLVVPVGAPEAWFDAGDRAAIARVDDRLRVVFFGTFTPLQGAPHIGDAIAAAEPSITFTMIGTGQDHAATRARAGGAGQRAQWRDWVDASELPEVVAGHDVCLGIFDDGAKAARVVPNKVYQGAAAGCVVVTSDTACQRRALGNAARYVPAADGAELAKALDELAHDRDRLSALKRESREHAERFRPAAVVGPLLDALREPR